jgi:prophage antirepressor-like protein
MLQFEKKKEELLQPVAFRFSATRQEVRSTMIQNEPWFIAKDICDILDLQQVNKALQSLDDDEKLTGKLFRSGQRRKVWLINESGLYNLIFRSNKPEAKLFRKWVTNDVLPTIRRTGNYGGLLLPTRIHSSEINGHKVYPFAKLARSLGYKSGGSLYYRRRTYPNHFIKIDKIWFVSEEMKQLMQISRSAIVHRKAIKNMQPLLPLDFGAPIQIGSGNGTV